MKHGENMNKTHNLYSNCHENQILVFDMRVQKVIPENQTSQPLAYRMWVQSETQDIMTDICGILTLQFITPVFWWTTQCYSKLFFSFPGLLQMWQQGSSSQITPGYCCMYFIILVLNEEHFESSTLACIFEKRNLEKAKYQFF